MPRKLPLQVRIDPALEGALKKLAKANRRSLTSEVNAILASVNAITAFIKTKKGN